MNEIVININWEYFIGIVGVLIGIAWYSGSKFSKIETSIEWIKNNFNRLETNMNQSIHELKTSSDNEKALAFNSQSPINLSERGTKWLNESGLKFFLDNNQNEIMDLHIDKENLNPYDIQENVFYHLDNLKFPQEIEAKLKEFAFKKGTSMNIMRRIAGIYARNLCLKEFGMNIEEIDNHKVTN